MGFYKLKATQATINNPKINHKMALSYYGPFWVVEKYGSIAYKLNFFNFYIHNIAFQFTSFLCPISNKLLKKHLWKNKYWLIMSFSWN